MPTDMASLTLLIVAFTIVFSVPEIAGAATFKFSSYYHDHMVLQQSSTGTSIWGQSSKVGDVVHIKLNNNEVAQTTVNSDHIWEAKFTSPKDHGPYNVSATSSLGTVEISDVLFGDVWICSGQSNMEYMTFGLLNATQEYADSLNYQSVRLFHVHREFSASLYTDVKHIDAAWLKPNQKSLTQYSAVCWLYGKYLSQHFNYPIGLVETNWGGTRIEAWSSPDALSACSGAQGRRKRDYNSNSQLYNAMINPLLRNTIKGVIWYQGESNAGHAYQYSCQFLEMIRDWRGKFSAASKGTTNPSFPFGFVQLAPWREGETSLGFPQLRWSQTANIGYVPNSLLHNVFMAVAIDLPDYQSPYGNIHPRYKHDVAYRLYLGALGVAYHERDVEFEGPFPTSAVVDSTHRHLTIECGRGLTPIEIRTNSGFEVCCVNHATKFCNPSDTHWINSTITSHDFATVTLNISSCNHGSHVVQLRYAWRESPCAFHQCAVYGKSNNLPGPPFTLHVSS
ncbi:sialate O-acetylesterase-like [Saccostrea echinata]|uniref:sialate O-acetylesterase-like n=1 Tax=Saccostrea echinata TaxID=191078 RepID=UPI002A80E843|nr:sialate O-acetylesterase-like [Saccostrea echinata]